jgi:hypothetical protein
MTSEPDSKPGRRPPTIELKATEIENPAAAQEDAAAAAAEGTPSGQEPPRAASDYSGEGPLPFSWRAAIGIALAVAIIAVIGGGLWLEGFDPFHLGANQATPPAATPAPEAAQPAAIASSTATPSPAATDEISARLDKIERAIQAQRPDAALGTRLTALEAQTKSLGDSLAALNRRVDGVAATSLSAAKQADAASAAADAAKSAANTAANNAAKSSEQKGVQQADVSALAERITALESAVKGLAADNAARQAPRADDTAARLTVAAEALRAAVERGVPYQAEFEAVLSLGADRNAVAPLEPFAAGGVPSPDALAHELAGLVPALDQASNPAAGDKTFIERLEANAQKLVRVTPVDAPTGTDPTSVVARIAFDASRADIAAALVDVAALPDAAKPLAADWTKKAQAREAAIAASRRIAADALAALSKPAAQ